MKKIDFEKEYDKNDLSKAIKNVEEIVKQLEEDGKYQLYFGKVFLGDVERKGENLILKINSDWKSSNRWNELNLFDKILKSTSTEKLNFEYGGFYGETKGEFEKKSGKLKYSFSESKKNPDYQLPYDDRSLLVSDFCNRRDEMWDKLANTDLLKERSIEIFSENGNSVTSSEKMNGDVWEINKLKIDFPEKKFEYNAEQEKEGELAYSDAIFLNEFCDELEKGLLDEVETKYNRFKNEVLVLEDDEGFEFKEFDTNDAAELFQGVWAYEEVNEDYKAIGDLITTENLGNALTAANEFHFRDVIDKMSGAIIRNEENEKKYLNINLTEGENFKDILNFYNSLKSENEFKNFKASNIKLNLKGNSIFVLDEGKKIKYKGETEVSEKEIYESLKKAGADKIEINEKTFDFENQKKVSNFSRK